LHSFSRTKRSFVAFILVTVESGVAHNEPARFTVYETWGEIWGLEKSCSRSPRIVKSFQRIECAALGILLPVSPLRALITLTAFFMVAVLPW
jgi:hypothetical protein